MQRHHLTLTKSFVCAAVALGLFAASSANAAPKVYTVDHTMSSLTLSGSMTVLGVPLPLMAQAPGSLTTTYGAAGTSTITADVTATTIDIIGASILADDNTSAPGLWTPAPGSTAGSAPGSYGSAFTIFTPFDLPLATRAFGLTLSSGGTIALSGSGDFSTIPVIGTVSSGVTDLGGPLVPGPVPVPMVGLGGVSIDPAGMGSLTTVGLEEILTVPVDISIAFLVPAPPPAPLGTMIPITATLTGTIVAKTPVVPEPASMSMLLAAVGLCVPGRRSRPRK